MARKPKSTDRGAPISAAEAKNALPSDIIAEAANDLYGEAELWLDGSDIETEAQAEGVSKLLDMARAAINDADREKGIEKRPHLDANKAIEDRYRPITAKLDRIVVGCKLTLTKWRNKLEAERRRQAEEAQRAAEEAQRKADAASVAAQGDIGAMEIAEGAQEEAARLERSAYRQERDAGKGLRMRTRWSVELTDRKAALKHYLQERPDDFVALLQKLAEEDVRGGARAIPGCTIIAHKEAY